MLSGENWIGVVVGQVVRLRFTWETFKVSRRCSNVPPLLRLFADHIIYLQQALTYYEGMLGHAHPAYLSHLKLSFSQARGGVDKAILMLSIFSMCAISMQVLTGQALVSIPIITSLTIFSGIFSLNVNVPTNLPDGGFFWFAAVCIGTGFVGLTVLGLIRFWWVQAKKKQIPTH